MNNILGHIVTGSLTEGLRCESVLMLILKSLKTGKFVSIDGKYQRFFCLITDLTLEVTHPDILLISTNRGMKSFLKKHFAQKISMQQQRYAHARA